MNMRKAAGIHPPPKVKLAAAFAAASCAYLVLASASASAFELADFAGKSIRATFSEIVHLPNGGEIRNVWRDELYVSTQNRIFHKFRIDSNNEVARANRESVSDETRTPFKLENDAFVRDFVNPRTGHYVHVEIRVAGSKPGASCTIEISRPGSGLAIEVLGQSCKVIAGNIVGH